MLFTTSSRGATGQGSHEAPDMEGVITFLSGLLISRPDHNLSPFILNPLLLFFNFFFINPTHISTESPEAEKQIDI
ncbi:MAG: hypothetical protein MUP22_05740, partial [Desulfobacterales bacterium]|nr:hypothetical protein [Desulfobacterales bacterium]